MEVPWLVSCYFSQPVLVWQTENPRTQEDIEWLERDLSSLDNYEPYEWQEGELQEGLPVKFIAETGKIEIGV